MPALSPRSVLEGRSSNRAPIPLIIGLAVSGFCLLLALTFYLWQGGPVNVVIGTGLALPTAVVLISLILLIDRLEPEPQLNLWLALGWGAGVAIIGALIVNTGSEILMAPVLGAETAAAITVSIVAPVVEESFKGALLLYLLWVRRHEIDGPTDGIVYAGMCGLGFALVENVLYYMQGLGAETGDIWVTVLIRGVIAPLGHPLYTAMTGLGVAYAATHRGVGRFFAVVGGWCGAVFLHALWNGSLTLAGFPGMVAAYLLQFLVLIAVIVVLVLDRKRLVHLIRRYLPAYIPSGLVQPNDVQMLGSMAGRRQARHWARAQAGTTGARAMGDYQLAATELALLHAQAEKNTIAPEAFFARREAILGLMRSARDAFFRRLPQAPAPPWARQERSGFFAPPAQLAAAQLPTYQPGGHRPPPGRPPQPPWPNGPRPGGWPPR
ncbi:PrsW family intramembrane metalloprotease [Saccharopolyspora phatthalungensis]|uniref:RsiW-degrading membrane proteinase PrsW (M82 family) n=1 Tax=Saccharopolyspora phatthalungensis TaxID=664693 RepID=A0A840Q5Y6_9PSEU|nr:PrsW family intramembrane metalloprotease [Saccharopolyspora phatthalungensis]MBB5157922.1 RsiW-degrading membrane proteinase PrsW (M82 family) [Saccharopolyspora phatthalungensis]